MGPFGVVVGGSIRRRLGCVDGCWGRWRGRGGGRRSGRCFDETATDDRLAITEGSLMMDGGTVRQHFQAQTFPLIVAPFSQIPPPIGPRHASMTCFLAIHKFPIVHTPIGVPVLSPSVRNHRRWWRTVVVVAAAVFVG